MLSPFSPFTIFAPIVILGAVAVAAVLVTAIVELRARYVSSRKAQAEIIYLRMRRISLRSAGVTMRQALPVERPRLVSNGG